MEKNCFLIFILFIHFLYKCACMFKKKMYIYIYILFSYTHACIFTVHINVCIYIYIYGQRDIIFAEMKHNIILRYYLYIL